MTTTSELIGDSTIAIDFLRRWSPGGLWVLSAIDPNGGGMETRTFDESRVGECGEWIDKWNGKRNLYFNVNEVMREVSKKTDIQDIRRLTWLHVDLDPKEGLPLQEEQDRIFKLVDNLPDGIPRPTVDLFSGGGRQLFWKLEEPVEINGNIPAAEDAKRYNQQLETLLGADRCHNIDRIMRLVGTVNLPNAKKRRGGRQPALAYLVRFDDTLHKLSDFLQAPIVQMKGGGGGFINEKMVQVSGNIRRLVDINELDQWGVPYRVKKIIMEGRNDEEPPKEKDDSRSTWLFDAVCGLVRAGVPDDVIYSIITDPDFKVSACILDKGSRAEKHAIRAIVNAKEHDIDPWLKDLNERHAVIANLGGKCRVIEEVMDTTLNRTRVTKQTFEDFRNRYMNKKIEMGQDANGKKVYAPVGKWWLQHEHRREFSTIVFAPNKETGDAYNMWKGFAYPPLPGDCSAYLEHMRLNICRGNELHYEYLLGWMARTVQHPDSPGQVAVVLKGPRGVGKSFFVKTFGALWGRHFLQVSDPKHLVGSFNAHLRDCVVLFGDEAFYAGDKKHESILKTLITEETIMIEGKGVDAEVAPNCSHLLLASNSHWVVPAGAMERRYFVLDVGEDQLQNAAYFKDLNDKMEAGGYSALLHYLMTYDLERYDVRAVPKTDALQEQKLYSLSVEEEWWYNRLQEGRLLESHDHWQPEIAKQELIEDYLEYTKRLNIQRRASPTALGKFLQRVTPGSFPRSYQRLATVQVPGGDGFMRKVQRRAYFYEFPSLQVCRSFWENQFGGAGEWNESELDLA